MVSMPFKTGTIRLSFVVPAKNASRLDHCMAAVGDYAISRGDQIELLICGSVCQGEAPEGVRFVEADSLYKGECVRAGVRASQGEVVIVCDDG